MHPFESTFKTEPERGETTLPLNPTIVGKARWYVIEGDSMAQSTLKTGRGEEQRQLNPGRCNA